MSTRVTYAALPLITAIALTVAAASAALAQPGPTGTLIGHLTFCRVFPRPVAEADGDTPTGPQLQDVTPGLRRPLPQPAQFPVADVQLSIQGTGITARTNANGDFTLAGVPAAQPLTVTAQVAPGTVMVLNNPNVSVGAGQTLDLGTLTMTACLDRAPAFFVQPAPSTADVDTAQPAPTDTATLDTTQAPADDATDD
jgi:hypothetical protein